MPKKLRAISGLESIAIGFSASKQQTTMNSSLFFRRIQLRWMRFACSTHPRILNVASYAIAGRFAVLGGSGANDDCDLRAYCNVVERAAASRLQIARSKARGLAIV